MINLKEQMIELYKQGYSDAEVRREVGLSKRQFDSYMETSEPFAEFIEFCRDLAAAWAFEQNRRAVTEQTYNSVNMKALEKRLENMHGWSQKVETKNANVNIKADIEQLRKELYQELPEMLKLAGKSEMVPALEHDPDSPMILPVSNDEE